MEAVVRHRHFTRAAEELHVAQSALSHQIRQLERELGISLFERSSRRVAPTDAGLAVAARARRVFAELDAARQEVDEFRGVLRGHIRIGALVPAGGVDVLGLLARFGRAHPGVEIALREGIAAEMFRRIADDELDAAFCLLAGEVPAGCTVDPLGHDEVVAAFAPDRAPAAPRVTVADLGREPIVSTHRGSAITTVLAGLFAEAGRPLRLALESGDPFLLRSLAARGFATAILPRSLTAVPGPELAVRGLDPAVRVPVALVSRRDRAAPPAARAFIEFVRREAASGG
ncbi:LysR substrate-binding domain-containing protein [Pseudonocardia adelaidensis]|uniref:LysR substrate-binding domain-containing protein n=1 Tax=Pseudonocardia adelaidensis TaxID=648754 RepID=A0ABP9P2G2_9PSEU